MGWRGRGARRESGYLMDDATYIAKFGVETCVERSSLLAIMGEVMVRVKMRITYKGTVLYVCTNSFDI